MKSLILAAALGLALTTTAHAVSIGQMAGDCGDDSKLYCKDVGYGEAMQQCLDAHYAQLTKACQLIIDRLNGGEGVSLF